MSFASLRMCLLVALLAGTLLPSGLSAQTYWRFPMTVGYGGLGVGVAALSSPGSASYDDFGLRVITGLAAGVVVGYVVGRLSDEALARGQDLGARRRWVVRLGTVLAGATVGTMAGGVITASENSSSAGSDEAIFAGLALTGAVAGGAIQYLWDSKLWPAQSVQGTLSPGGRGVSLSLRIAH